MFTPSSRNAIKDIKELLTNINRSGLQGHAGELGKYFHRDMVIASPGLKVVARGREACVQSYQDFIDRATILDYQDSDCSVDVWGGTAVASCRFQIAYVIKGQKHRDTGHDLFVFVQQLGERQAIWRTLIVVVEFLRRCEGTEMGLR